MHNMGCRCGHHWVAKILAALAWVAAVGFWWMAWQEGVLWEMDVLAWSVVLLSLLAFSTKFCGCCGGHGMGKMGGMMMNGGKCDHENGICKHGPDCKCGGCKVCM